MEFSDYFPIWDQLEPKHQEKLKAYSSHRRVKKGTIIHSGEMNCIGVLLIHSGQLRAYSIYVSFKFTIQRLDISVC